MKAPVRILPEAFAAPAMADSSVLPPELAELTDAQVNALVSAAPVAAELPAEKREVLQRSLGRIARQVAALALEDWRDSETLGQRPVVKTVARMRPASQPMAKSMRAADFRPQAASRVGEVTRSTLNAIAFPTFVADLIKGTFSAILDATTSQMDAFMKLLEQVSQTVEQFEDQNISDAQAHSWLVQQYPGQLRLEGSDSGPRAVAVDDGAEPPAGIRQTLNLPEEVSSLDETSIEEVLVPAARRKLAQSRLQMLSSLVMMGMQRIVINHGRIRATMGFHIDASDSARREEASLLDTSVAAAGSVGFGPWSASVSTSVTYVRSTKSDSNAELNVNADLTGEVDLTFSTDYLPLNRMATVERIARIRENTPNPVANTPNPATVSESGQSSSPSAADMINTRLSNRTELTAPELPQRQAAAGGGGGGGGGGGSESAGGGEAAAGGGGGETASGGGEGH